jgi:indole-3-pyruvate monooxygenase
MSDSLMSTWRHRTYDRLTLHLPRRFCELPLLPFPEDFPTYPSKDQFVAYMEAYAAAAGVAPRFGARVEEARFDAGAGAWAVRLAGGGENVLRARWLVVATGENAVPRVPDFPGARQFAGRVMHTCEYKSGEAFAGEKVLVVGCGNSGMEVSLDLCRHGAKPSLVVRNTVNTSIASFVPFCFPLMLTTTCSGVICCDLFLDTLLQYAWLYAQLNLLSQ